MLKVIQTIAAVILATLAWLIWAMTVRDVGRIFVHGGVHTYIGAANLGYAIFDGGVAVILSLIALLLARRHLHQPNVRIGLLVAGLAAVGLGAYAGQI